MRVHDYFAGIERGIRENRKSGFLGQPVLAKAFDEHHGLFKAHVYFWDGSQLTIEEAVSTEQGHPEVLRYSYTYTRNNVHVFRYDNAPHYPHFSTFPHHKHVGPDETPGEDEKPSLSEVFTEIEAYLASQ